MTTPKGFCTAAFEASCFFTGMAGFPRALSGMAMEMLAGEPVAILPVVELTVVS